MHKNRSPCTPDIVSVGDILHEGVRDSLTPQRERLSEPPPEMLTPERAAARGLAQEGAVISGMLLHEEAPFIPNKPTVKTEKRDGESVTVVKMDVAYCDIINRNGRYYPRSCYEAANARAATDIAEGGLWSLMDHPEYWEPVKGSLPNIVIKIEELGIDDKQVEWPIGSGQTKTLGVVWAKGVIVETAKGLDAKALLKSKVRVGVSTNGWASSQYVRAGDLDPSYYDPEELIPVTQDDFTYFSIDLVSDPSNLGGRASTEALQLPSAPSSRLGAAPDGTLESKNAQEGTMHELLLKLLEKYPGKTLEQVKVEYAAEYLQVLEQIAAEGGTPTTESVAPAAPVAINAPAPASAPAAPPLPTVDYNAATVDMAAYRALESRVVQLTQENTGLREQLRNQTRDTIALTALEAARLPSSGQFEDNGVTIDLDASFRNDLIATSRSASSDSAAKEAVERKITERRAMLGNRTQESRRPRGQFDHLSRVQNPGPSIAPRAAEDGMQESYAPLAQAFRELF